MRETELIKKDEVLIVDQSQVKKQTYLGSTTIHTGHTLFEFDKITYELRKAKFEYGALTITRNSKGISHGKKSVKIKENCFYISSLNAKNAIRKIHRLFTNVPYVIAINE